MRVTAIVSFITTLIGSINWFLIGVFKFNLVHFICGTNSTLERAIYTLIGFCALWMVFFSFIYKPFNHAK